MITENEIEDFILKIAIVITAAAFLVLTMTGCAQFENRVACTVSGDKAYLVSEYMRLGISAEVATKDAQRICPGGDDAGTKASTNTSK